MAIHRVLHISRYSFNDSSTGRPVSGCKLQYVEANPINDESRRGTPAPIISADYSLWQKITQLPALYDLNFSSKLDSRGRPVLTVVDAQLAPKQQ